MEDATRTGAFKTDFVRDDCSSTFKTSPFVARKMQSVVEVRLLADAKAKFFVGDLIMIPRLGERTSRV